MSLEKQYRELQAKIDEITTNIFMAKDDLIEMYDSDHPIPILPHRERKMSLVATDTSDKAFTSDALKCTFYQTFMTAREKELSTNIIVTFPCREKTVHGVELKRENDDKYTVKKINLPLYISPKRIFKNMKYLSVDDLRSNLDLVYKCISATKNRTAQISTFKNFDNKIGRSSISPCTQVIRLTTLMETKNRGDTMVFIVFSYNSTGFRPSTIEIQFETDLLNENLKSKLTKQLSTFSEQEFLEGYKAFFKL